MAEQGDNKDALLEKLDNLMRSGRAPKRDDPPPLLTDAIPDSSESQIPTLTDVVTAPESGPENGPKNDPEKKGPANGSQAADTDAGEDVAAESEDDAPLEYETSSPDDADKEVPLEFETGSPDDADKDAPLEFEHVEPVDAPPPGTDDHQQESAQAEFQEGMPAELQQEGPETTQHGVAADSHEFVSSRLLAVLDREMTSLSGALPDHKDKLSVLHRSLRFALPELIRLRWEESPADESDDDNDDLSEPEQ